MTKAFVVEREAVSNNLKIIRAKAENAIVIGVLKGNAYGFGLIEVARLMREQGIHFLAVTEPGDLVKLRDAGFSEENILLLRSTAIPSELETIIVAALPPLVPMKRPSPQTIWQSRTAPS